MSKPTLSVHQSIVIAHDLPFLDHCNNSHQYRHFLCRHHQHGRKNQIHKAKVDIIIITYSRRESVWFYEHRLRGQENTLTSQSGRRQCSPASRKPWAKFQLWQNFNCDKSLIVTKFHQDDNTYFGSQWAILKSKESLVTNMSVSNRTCIVYVKLWQTLKPEKFAYFWSNNFDIMILLTLSLIISLPHSFDLIAWIWMT